MPVCWPRVIWTWGRCFGEHLCTALVLTSLLPLVLLPYDYEIITGFELAKARHSRPVIISIIMASGTRTVRITSILNASLLRGGTARVELSRSREREFCCKIVFVYDWVNCWENYSISAPPVRRIGPGRVRQCWLFFFWGPLRKLPVLPLRRILTRIKKINYNDDPLEGTHFFT